MLRRFLLYLSAAGWARNIVTHWGVARRVALRFVAGETLDEAVKISRALKDEGILVTLDYLGESVNAASDTVEVVDTYCAILDQIHAHQLDASASLKLTHIGLDIDEQLCIDNLRTILTRAQQHNNIPITIDMESSAYTDVTLKIYRTMRDEYGFKNVGTVMQAYLYRTDADMQALAAEGSHIRLCKGAYLEPASVAYPAKADVDKNYVDLARAYLQSDAPAYLCLATHDEAMIAQTEPLVRAQTPPRYEYQMLYGIRSERQRELVKAGHPMRVYVPFGEAWYPYFMRRLAERPANLWFFARSLFSR